MGRDPLRVGIHFCGHEGGMGAGRVISLPVSYCTLIRVFWCVRQLTVCEMSDAIVLYIPARPLHPDPLRFIGRSGVYLSTSHHHNAGSPDGCLSPHHAIKVCRGGGVMITWSGNGRDGQRFSPGGPLQWAYPNLQWKWGGLWNSPGFIRNLCILYTACRLSWLPRRPLGLFRNAL